MTMFQKTALLIPMTIALASCMKKEGFENDNGPQATTAEVQSALINAWGNVDPATIAKGEFVYVEKNQSIEGMPAKIVMQDAITVADRTVTPTEIQYKLYHQTNEIIDGQSKVSTKEEILTIPNTANVVTAQQLGVINFQSLLFACEKADKWDVTCHNLKTFEQKEDPPELVRKQSNCAGIPGCKITKKYVSFDLVLKTPLANGQTIEEKVNYKVGISPDVPYLSRMMDFCFRGLVNVGNPPAPYLVSLCDKVENFRTGQN